MAKKPTRLKKLRLTELSLVHAGANQHSSIGIYKASDAEPPRAPTTAEIAHALVNATPEAREIYRKATEAAYRDFMKFAKSINEPEDQTMTYDPNFHYNEAVAKYAAKHDLSIAKAGVEIIKNREDLVAEAVAKDEHNRALRLQAEQKRLYG